MNCATTFAAELALVCFTYTLTFVVSTLAENVPSKLTPELDETGEETVPYVVNCAVEVSCARSTSEI